MLFAKASKTNQGYCCHQGHLGLQFSSRNRLKPFRNEELHLHRGGTVKCWNAFEITRAATLMAVLAGACGKYGWLNTHNKLWQQSPKWRGSALLKPDFCFDIPPQCHASFLTWRSIGQSANEFGQVYIFHILHPKVTFSKRPNWGTSSINLLPLLSKEHPGKPSSSCPSAIVGFAIQIAVINSHPAEFGWVKREATFYLDNKSLSPVPPVDGKSEINVYICVLFAEISTTEGLTKRSLTWC